MEGGKQGKQGDNSALKLNHIGLSEKESDNESQMLNKNNVTTNQNDQQRLEEEEKKGKQSTPNGVMAMNRNKPESLMDNYLNSDQYKQDNAKNTKENPPEKSTAKKVAQGISIAIAAIAMFLAIITGMVFLMPLIYVGLVALGIEMKHEENQTKYLKNATQDFVKYAEANGQYPAGKEREEFMQKMGGEHKMSGETLDWAIKSMKGDHLMSLDIEAKERELGKGGINRQPVLNVNQHIGNQEKAKQAPTLANGNKPYKESPYTTPKQILESNKIDLNGTKKIRQQESSNINHTQQLEERKRNEEKMQRDGILKHTK